MISLDKKYKTRNGREVRLYSVDGGGDYPIHGAILQVNNTWEGVTWTQDGLFCESKTTVMDLIEVKAHFKTEIFFVGYSDGEITDHEDLEEAQKHLKNWNRNWHGKDVQAVAIFSRLIEFTEGEGL